MTITKRIAFGAAASWFSRGLTILLGLLLMPVLFRNLPREELGVWLLLGQSWAALGIFDLGFGVTLTRRIAFAKGKSGSDPNAPLTDETLREIADLVATAKRVYRALAIFAFVMSFGAGFFYLRSLEINTVPLTHVWWAWGILCLSQALGVWATVWTSLLQGVGYIGWDAILASLVNALMLAVQIVVVLLGGGLVSLAVVAACGALAQRLLILGFARRKRPELFSVQGDWQPKLVKNMMPLAFRAWLTTFGLVLAMQTDQFFIASIKGATEIPAYRAAYLVFINLNMLAITFATASGVFVSHLWQAGKILEIHRILQRNLRLGLGLFVCGGSTVIALGTSLFDVWIGPGNFIGYPILAVFFAMQFLEVQAYIISTASRATEDEAFAGWSLGGGLLKIVLALLLAPLLGLLGIALATFLALIFTNHWVMAYRGFVRLRFSFRDHLTRVLLPVGGFGLVTGTLLFAGRWLTRAESAWLHFSFAVAASGILFCAFVWSLALSRSERLTLLEKLRLRSRQSSDVVAIPRV